MITTQLPFPREQTASFGDLNIAGPNGLSSMLPSSNGHPGQASAYRPDLAGLIVETIDDVIGNTTVAAAVGTSSGKYLAAGTKRRLLLRCVQLSADLTIDCIGQLVAFSTTAGYYGAVVTETAGQGLVTKPLDGAYPVGTVLKKYDWAYAIEEGPCIITPANGQTLAAHGPATCYDTAGHAGPALAGDALLGVSDAAVTGAISGTTSAVLAKIYVNAGLAQQEAAG